MIRKLKSFKKKVAMFNHSEEVLDDMIEVKKKVTKFVDSSINFIESIHKPIPFLNTILGSDKKKKAKKSP